MRGYYFVPHWNEFWSVYLLQFWINRECNEKESQNITPIEL